MNIEQYVSAISSTLDHCLCLRSYSSPLCQKLSKPQIQMSGYDKKTKPLVTKPIYLARSKKQHCVIQPSINAVRISFVIKKNDETDQHIAGKIAQFMEARADSFQIVRRKPIKGYDISFLVTNQHLQLFDKKRLIAFILDFISNIQKDIAQIRLNINAQTRIAATNWVTVMSCK